MLIRRIKEAVGRAYKKRLFLSRATCKGDLSVTSSAWCTSPTKGQLVIGDGCDLAGCRIYVIGDGKVEIGRRSTIRGNSKISSVSGVRIGSHAIISNNVNIYDHNSHPTDPSIRREMSEGGAYGDAWSPTRAASAPVVIEENVWIGERSTVLKGVTIGRGSIVASNAVVTKDVPPYTIVAGNPARVVKKLVRHEDEGTEANLA